MYLQFTNNNISYILFILTSSGFIVTDVTGVFSELGEVVDSKQNKTLGIQHICQQQKIKKHFKFVQLNIRFTKDVLQNLFFF